MDSKISDLSSKINLVIGDLLSKADPVSKSLLTAFDSSKDMHVNSKLMSSSRFSKENLVTCAQFLKIETEDLEGNPLFSNKPSLADRIILEIQSLYPAICGSCDTEYSIKFDSESKPLLRCFLCFQGCHDCELFAEPTVDPSKYPPGIVWLCSTCHTINNPIKPAKSKASRAASRDQSRPQTPVRDDNSQVSLDKNELLTRLNKLKVEQVDSENSSSHTNKQSVQFNDVCELFQLGKCPHGVSGKKSAKGKPSCSKSHPKRCTKFIKYGKKNRYGCRRGDKCKFFHPQHCPTSLSQKSCYSEECTLVHLAGTRRRKPPDQESNRRKDTKNNKRGLPSKDNSQRSRSRATSESQNTKSSPHTSTDFLELRSLLITFKDTLQKDIVGLKSSIAEQEIRINTVLPALAHPRSYTPLPLPPHSFHPSLQHPSQIPLPQPHQFLQQGHPQTQMTWQNTQVSGC